MDEELSEDLEWPYPTQKMERAVGSFILTWNVLERELDVGFSVLFRINPTLASCVYANLGTKAKLDILSSAFHMLSGAFDQRLIDSTKEVLGEIRDCVDKARNVLAHGQIFRFRSEDQITYVMMRQAARNEFSMTIHPSDAKYWDGRAIYVSMLARELRRNLAAIHKILGQLSFKQIDDLCEVTVKESEATQERRRNSPPPKKAGSQRHQPKRGKRK